MVEVVTKKDETLQNSERFENHNNSNDISKNSVSIKREFGSELIPLDDVALGPVSRVMTTRRWLIAYRSVS